MSVGRDVDNILARMRTIAQGPSSALDPNRVQSSSSDSQAPRDYGDTLAGEWAELFARMVLAAETSVDRHKRVGAHRARNLDRETRNARITSDIYNDQPHSLIAYIEGCSESHVWKLRGRR